MGKTNTPNAEGNEAKELVRLCRAGRLYEIERWIRDGKSLEIPATAKRGRQRSLLEIAVEAGFHSLVELIAKHGASQSAKDAALADAVSSRRLDLVELLLANGTDIKSVSLADVLLTWEPTLIRFFLDRGADPIDGKPFAEAFGAKVRTTLRPFIECKRAHPELATALQDQLDCALRHFCSEGDLKWVSLLMWAGGDPRSRGPCLEKEYTEDPECYTSGLEEACYSENLDVLKRLKPDFSRDNLNELLDRAAIWGRKATLEYLLEIGATANDKTSGGSSALDTVLRHFNFARFDANNWNRLKSRYDVYRRVSAELERRGVVVNHKRVLRLMRLDNLLAVRKQRFVFTTDSRHTYAVYPHLAERLVLTAVNQLWVADSAVIIRRTALEDRFLKAHLPGYGQYMFKVRYRVFFGIW